MNLQKFLEETDREFDGKFPMTSKETIAPHIKSFLHTRFCVLLEEVVGEVQEAIKLKPYTEWQKGYTKALSDLASHLREEIKKIV